MKIKFFYIMLTATLMADCARNGAFCPQTPMSAEMSTVINCMKDMVAQPEMFINSPQQNFEKLIRTIIIKAAFNWLR